MIFLNFDLRVLGKIYEYKISNYKKYKLYVFWGFTTMNSFLLTRWVFGIFNPGKIMFENKSLPKFTQSKKKIDFMLIHEYILNQYFN